jgi:hypothetical protein
VALGVALGLTSDDRDGAMMESCIWTMRVIYLLLRWEVLAAKMEELCCVDLKMGVSELQLSGHVSEVDAVVRYALKWLVEDTQKTIDDTQSPSLVCCR